MRITKFILIFILLLSFTLSGCSDSSETGANTDFAKTESEMISDRDKESTYSEENSTLILLKNTMIECNSSKVTINGTTVTIKSGGTYILTGELSDGKIIVDAADTDKPQIVLNGVNVTSATSAALYVKNCDKLFVTIAENTENFLRNGETFTQIDDNNIDGAIFSKDDLTFNGSGKLTIESAGGHGIVCKDDLVFAGGCVNVSSLLHGIDANDSVRISGAELSLTAKKDGIHVENSEDTTQGFFYESSGSLSILADDDGISCSAYIQIEDGTFNINSGKLSSTDNTGLKGIKAEGSILINGGVMTVSSKDDCIHSNTSVIINGGEIELSTSDDGIHADETLQITDGNIDITKSYEGLEALTIEISGGKISVVASDDGINAAGGNDQSGFEGFNPGGDRFGGGKGGFGGFGANTATSNGKIIISGGTVNIKASGDGIDSNGSLSITGGKVIVNGPTSGDTAVLDYDTTGTISGGRFYGSGASMMMQTLTGSGQGVIAVSVGSVSSNTLVTLTDEEGIRLASFMPAYSYQIVIISTPEIVSGNSYTLTVGTSVKTVTAK